MLTITVGSSDMRDAPFEGPCAPPVPGTERSRAEAQRAATVGEIGSCTSEGPGSWVSLRLFGLVEITQMRRSRRRG
jgi:hypothetical protein